MGGLGGPGCLIKLDIHTTLVFGMKPIHHPPGSFSMEFCRFCLLSECLLSDSRVTEQCKLDAKWFNAM
ncbi:hypothetical protein CLOM_g12726 [Closterium sp. NIES-68]|nr:hypothetical protein CLOM_g12726 [Closterium sp. NIES-68]GJP61300.1 hypothetical protein CLOP_g18472 [Closterium sp. NIES-67]